MAMIDYAIGATHLIWAISFTGQKIFALKAFKCTLNGFLPFIRELKNCDEKIVDPQKTEWFNSNKWLKFRILPFYA